MKNVKNCKSRGSAQRAQRDTKNAFENQPLPSLFHKGAQQFRARLVFSQERTTSFTKSVTWLTIGTTRHNRSDILDGVARCATIVRRCARCFYMRTTEAQRGTTDIFAGVPRCALVVSCCAVVPQCAQRWHNGSQHVVPSYALLCAFGTACITGHNSA